MSDHESLRQAKLERINQTHRCAANETALLVIDMQHGFLDKGASLAVATGWDIMPNIANLIEACRQKNVPVIFTEFVYTTNVPCLRGDPFGIEHLPAVPGEPTGLWHASSNCLIGHNAGEGIESAATVEELAPRPDELVVQAHTYDKFYGTPLDLKLRSQNIRRLIFTGMTTDVCVNSTLIAASTRDYRVTAVTDAMASPWPDLHEACFKIWEPKFARLRTSAEVVGELAEL
jgi:nicotinamidase-related amidase